MTTTTLPAATVNAAVAALAWANAFLAAGRNNERTALYRTVSVEFFPDGIQFVSCDGALLFRTWAPIEDKPMPALEECPDYSVIVIDRDKFALAFMKTLIQATKNKSYEPLIIAVEPVPIDEGADEPLGEAFASERLTLSALNQQLHCTVFEGQYPDWRKAEYGYDKSERVDGLTIAPRMFATVGKLRGVCRVECEFSGTDKAILFHASGETDVRGMIMPMRRDQEKGETQAAVEAVQPAQVEAAV
jgi:hypothetical protein